ncbi:uncharacterized protein LOC131936313 [Physella acuta]|uniref:uncharacterized protein LOC131936313 n=1 Tax=Physella acuta TaxID=109671 RepID=UPI0027DAE45B|nr:uncharacterized protein LOC131936313 [Physella acuta]
MVLVTEHLCFTMEKDDFLAVVLSECFTDQTIRDQVYQAVIICEYILNAQRDSAITSGSTGVDCKVVEQYSACYLKSYTDHCGQKIGVLRHKMFSVLLPMRFESSNCGNLTENLLTEKLS